MQQHKNDIVYDHSSLFTQNIDITHASKEDKNINLQRGEYKIYLPIKLPLRALIDNESIGLGRWGLKNPTMPIILSEQPQNFSRESNDKKNNLNEKREIPLGSSEEYWAMNESLTQSI